jgi:site-specific recombinase XerD
MSVLDQSQNQDTQNEEDVYFNFINSIKSEVTKRIYENDIKLYLKFCNLTKLSELLMITDPQKQMIKYIMSLRKKGLATNSISTLLNGIYHFYEMNDIPLNKKKINMFKGEFTGKVIDRSYTHEEIRKVLDVSDLRMKVMILLMASSGMRIGALPSLRLRNLERIDSIYKVTVYEGTNSSYYTFCTPECSSFIDAYFEYRTQNSLIPPT